MEKEKGKWTAKGRQMWIQRERRDVATPREARTKKEKERKTDPAA